MRITLAGSLGRIGAPLARTLVGRGHRVTVISSEPERRAAIEAIGATAAIGRLGDVDFLAAAYRDADVGYVMVPPANYFDQGLDLVSYFANLGEGFAAALVRAGTRRVVNLSSIGAHLARGNGILAGTHRVEESLESLPADVSVTHVRPTEIYYNLYGQLPLLRERGILGSTPAAGDVNAWVAPADIAAAVVEEVERTDAARAVRYVASEETTYGALASTLGAAVGMPDLPWVRITGEELRGGLVGVGMQPAIAEGMVEMYDAIHTGLLYEHYRAHPPASFGPTKVADFARDFAAAYRS